MSKKFISLLIIFILFHITAAVADEFELLNKEKIGDFSLGMTEKDLKGKIPCPLKRDKETLWGADGMYHQSWDYPACGISFGMSSDKKGGKKSIERITITPPSTLKTKRGIGIGSSEQDVIQAYQKEKDTEASKPKEVFVAGSVYGGLIFDFKNDKVVSIFMGAAAE